MGRLIYSPTSSFDIEDRLLYHLRVVMMNKLRRSESFMAQMVVEGGGRISIWIAPSLPLFMQFFGGRIPEIDQALLEKMMRDASSADGLTLSKRTDRPLN
jgi:hypothetical protein